MTKTSSGVDSPEREQLIREAQCAGPDAAEAMNILIVQEHPRIRAEIRRLRIYPQDVSDALQSGYLGFIRAVHAYEFDRGATLSTFARYYVRGQIIEDIIGRSGECFRPRRQGTDSEEEPVPDVELVADTRSRPVEDVVTDRLTVFEVAPRLSPTERLLVEALAGGANQARAAQALGMSQMAVSRARRRIAAKAGEVLGSLVA